MPDHDAIVRDFDRFTSSYLPALFATALFDQVALPSVAAGVEWGGRLRQSPIARGLRSAAADQLVFLGDDLDAQREAERIVRLHSDVRGTGPDGTSFSALHPESWNWILMSTFRMYRGGFETIRGRALDPGENQAVWSYYRTKAIGIEHPDERFRLPHQYEDMATEYDRIAADRCRANDTLTHAVNEARHPTVPAEIPAAGRPLWNVVLAPVIGRLATALGFSLLSPAIRRHADITPDTVDRAVVGTLTPLLRLAYRTLPDRLLLTPLAYHRARYRTIADRYHGIALTDFRPGRPV